MDDMQRYGPWIPADKHDCRLSMTARHLTWAKTRITVEKMLMLALKLMLTVARTLADVQLRQIVVVCLAARVPMYFGSDHHPSIS